MVLTNDFFLSVWEWRPKSILPPPRRPHPYASELDSGFIPRQPSHNSSLFGCLCCTFILFAGTFPWPSHLSTWKTLMRLQRDIKASPSPRRFLWLLRFMAFFFFQPSSDMKDHQCFPHVVCMCTDTHFLSPSQPRSHVQTEWSVNQIRHPQCFRGKECARTTER